MVRWSGGSGYSIIALFTNIIREKPDIIITIINTTVNSKKKEQVAKNGSKINPEGTILFNDMKTEIQQLKYEMQQLRNEMRNSINNNNTKQQKKETEIELVAIEAEKAKASSAVFKKKKSVCVCQ